MGLPRARCSRDVMHTKAGGENQSPTERYSRRLVGLSIRRGVGRFGRLEVGRNDSRMLDAEGFV